MTGIVAIRKFLQDQRGAAAIEFAAIALPLLLLLVGSMEISRYIWTRVALQDAASSGARCLGLRLAPCFGEDSMNIGETERFVKEQARQWAVLISDDMISPEATAVCHSIPDFAKIGIRHRFSSVLTVLPDTWINVEACFPVLPSE